MIRWIGGMIDRCFAVAGALIFSQVPAFIQQYQHQLKGHIAELKWQLDVMQNAAQLSNKTLEQYIAKFISSTDLDFSRQGEIMQGVFNRYQQFSQTLNALSEAPIWSKLFVLMQHGDLGLAQSTWAHFELGIPMSSEGLIYAFLGIIVGYSILSLLKLPFKWIYRVFKNKPIEPKPTI